MWALKIVTGSIVAGSFYSIYHTIINWDSKLDEKSKLLRRFEHLDKRIIPVYDLPLRFEADPTTWSNIFVLERLTYYNYISYEFGTRWRDDSIYIRIIKCNDDRISGTIFESEDEICSLNNYDSRQLKYMFLKTYSTVNTRRTLTTLLLIRQYIKNSKGNLFQVMPKDIFMIIVKMIWDSRNDDCWVFDEFKLVQELGKSNRESISLIKLGKISAKISTKRIKRTKIMGATNPDEIGNYRYLNRCMSIPIWVDFEYKNRVTYITAEEDDGLPGLIWDR